MFKNKLPFIVFSIVIAGLLIWGFVVFKQRKNESANNIKENIEQQTQNEQQAQSKSSDQQASENNDTASSNSIGNSDENSSDENATLEKTSLTEVSSKDCDNNCKNFTDSKELKYCQEVCGLVPIQEESKKNKGCDALKDLEKDYCLKDEAINAKDFKICEEIEDSGIQKTCQNRITEDILDSQK